MPKIEDMKFRRRRPERFLILWDSGEETVFCPETVLRYGMRIGREFSEDELLSILQEDSLRRAKDQALRYLEIRPHSRKELFRKLRKKGYLSRISEQALDELQAVDLINDESFARLFIQNELKFRPCGKMLLKQKLFEKGIPPEIFEPLLDEAFRKDTEIQIAHRVLEKYLRINRHLPKNKLREKCVRHLQSKGFPWEIIQQILLEEGSLRVQNGD